MSICLDQYVMTKEDLNDLNPGSNKDNYRTCNYFRKNINGELIDDLEARDVRASHGLNPKPIVNVISGCCNIKDNIKGKHVLNSLLREKSASSQVFNISNMDDLNKVLDEKKGEYMLNWSNVKGAIDSITNTPFIPLNNKTKTSLIKTKEDILFLLRDIISIEQDIERVDIMNQKLNMNAEGTKKTYDISNKNYKDEKELIKEFREKKDESKNQKLQYYDKQNFILYNNLFYISLILISGLFIRNQIRSK